MSDFRRRLMAAVGRKGPRQYTITVHPTLTDSSLSDYESVDNEGRAFADSSSTTYASYHWNKGSGAETFVYLDFDFSQIPLDATIISVTGSKKVNMTGYQSSRWSARSVALSCGTTIKSTEYAMGGSAANWSEEQAGTWTAAELHDAKLRIYVKRSTNSSYYNSDYVLQVYGADMTVTYEI